MDSFEDNITSIFDQPGSSFDTQDSLFLDTSTDNICGKGECKSEQKSVGSYSSKGGKKDHGGTVVCGVCGAVRYYSFVKQAKKFGVYSCESCRKFISKMIHSKGGGKVKCNEDKGECTVPPYVINPLDSIRYSHLKGRNARCPACWLKMCLQAFRMPGDLSAFLGSKLPDYMQDPSIISSILTYKFKDYPKKQKERGIVELDTYNDGDEKEDTSQPEARQKRKAATKFMENIARITGRVTDEISEYEPLPSENKRKKTTGSKKDETWYVKKKQVRKEKKKEKIAEHQTSEVSPNSESVQEEDEKRSEGSDIPSVQDVIRKVGRPRLIVLTRNLEFSNEESDGIKREPSDESTDTSFVKEGIEEDPFYNWHVIG